MPAVDQQRLRSLADQVRALAGPALEDLLAEAGRAQNPGAELARVFGCSRRRRDQTNMRNLSLVKLAQQPRFASLGNALQADAIEKFLVGYFRTRWTKDKTAAASPYESGEDDCAWRVLKAHTAVSADRRPVSGPPSSKRIYAVLREFSDLAMDVRTARSDRAGSTTRL